MTEAGGSRNKKEFPKITSPIFVESRLISEEATSEHCLFEKRSATRCLSHSFSNFVFGLLLKSGHSFLKNSWLYLIPVSDSTIFPTMPYSFASSADNQKLRSVSFSICSSVCPVALAINWFTRLRIRKISLASI